MFEYCLRVMKILKKNSNSYKTILTLLIYFFISGLQLSLANTFINFNDENICKSTDDSNENDIECISHCILEINSDYNSEKLVDITKNHKLIFSSQKKFETLNFLNIEPKSNSPPFFLI
ncbi:MAG: hypothetical protein CMM99_01265 [Rickettsiales bacterium]|nr:hypothetical protein [Rickettsiales bacterium]